MATATVRTTGHTERKWRGPRCWLMFIACSLIVTGCVWLPVPYAGYKHISIKGRLVDAESGLPLQGARVTWPIVGSTQARVYTTSPDGTFEARPGRRFCFGYTLAHAIPLAYAWNVYMKIEDGRHGAAYLQTNPYVHFGWMTCNPRLRELVWDLGTLQMTTTAGFAPSIYNEAVEEYERELADYFLDQVEGYEDERTER